MNIKTKDNKNIYCEILNNQHGLPVVVLLNGLSQTTASWGFMTPLLKEKYTVVLVDFVFQGSSDKEGDWRDFDQHAEDVIGVMLPYVLSDHYFNNPIIPIELLKSMRKDVVEAKALEKLMTATLYMKDYRRELTKIKAQTLVIHGGKDMLFPVELGKSVSDHIESSKFVVLPDAGHTLNLENVPQVYNLIKEFI